MTRLPKTFHISPTSSTMIAILSFRPLIIESNSQDSFFRLFRKSVPEFGGKSQFFRIDAHHLDFFDLQTTPLYRHNCPISPYTTCCTNLIVDLQASFCHNYPHQKQLPIQCPSINGPFCPVRRSPLVFGCGVQHVRLTANPCAALIRTKIAHF